MRTEKVVFAFFIVFALTLNFGFFLGDFSNVHHHNVYELFAAIVVNLIATVLKFGDRTHLGSVFLATSLVADLQLICAAIIWGIHSQVLGAEMDENTLSTIVSLSGGALLANIISIVLLVAETVNLRR